MHRRWAGVAVGFLLLSGCGGGGDGSAATGVERYCRISDELDRASDALVNTGTDTDEKIAQGFSELMQEHGDDFDDLVAAAPAEIKTDVASGVKAFRKAATGDFSALEAFDQTRIAAFDAENCGK